MSFIVHRLGSQIAVSEKINSTTNIHQFQVRELINADGIRKRFGAPLTDRETSTVNTFLAAFERVEDKLKTHQLSDPTQFSEQLTDLSEIAVFDGLLSYLKSEYVFQRMLKSYEKQNPEERFGTEISLDIYRQCCNRHKLEPALWLIKADLPILNKTIISRHQKECFYDIFYEILMRTFRIDLAIGCLEAAFKLNRTPERALGLVNAFIARGHPNKGEPFIEWLRTAGHATPTLEKRYADAIEYAKRKGNTP